MHMTALCRDALVAEHTPFTGSVSHATERVLGLWHANMALIRRSLNFIPNILQSRVLFLK